MPKFYVKNESDEFVDGANEVESYFRERSDEIVRKKLAAAKEKQTTEIRAEIEAEARKTVSDKIREEIRGELKGEFQEKLDAAESKAKTFETSLRRKTIAAEYGFDTKLEDFLGEGTDDEMRAKADLLKSGMTTKTEFSAPDKKISDGGADGFVRLTGETD